MRPSLLECPVQGSRDGRGIAVVFAAARLTLREVMELSEVLRLRAWVAWLACAGPLESLPLVAVLCVSLVSGARVEFV